MQTEEGKWRVEFDEPWAQEGAEAAGRRGRGGGGGRGGRGRRDLGGRLEAV